ncbi:aminotransferase class V-fold PLP-dependent enzyme [Solirubrobacter sp. CPCC 204708]|uniref:Aminotransferase class V-fold PLP-dependent enzyme n=1 Tax=Solirubrobacter deserti TaxID=2282478 RepID=A0ABT4RNN2_9ACTN|nr:aminotransferase class V-fold PLP-dependent enzyme [Solirubrobacter deserti]MBE2314932.1 aminotransferase class V-fold PLP-dependent enzyme [Solirubrobacter deserti]MDA0140163.1 aminotransferase class V-fold PLP-dependent enzyme [Solirubrobacter deserti]
MAFRDQFPVLQSIAYLNAGTDGPIPLAAAETARAELDAQLSEGRLHAHFARRHDLAAGLREGYARVMHAAPEHVAVTSGTSAGLGAVLAGMDIGPADEIVTSDAEHPGLIGPLIGARHRGATIKAVPFAELANAVTAKTTLVAASHVSWITGELAPAELAEVPVPVILDGAQGSGAVRVDVGELNCAAYAAAGQKWLCGADGTGMLYLDPELGERVRTVNPTYFSFEDTSLGLQSPLKSVASRFDLPLPREAVALSAAALEVLEAEGLDAIITRAADLADRFATALADAGYTVAPRGRSTLIAFEVDEPEAKREQLLERGVAVRDLPGTPYLRASVGAWNDESDLDRLLEALEP